MDLRNRNNVQAVLEAGLEYDSVIIKPDASDFHLRGGSGRCLETTAYIDVLTHALPNEVYTVLRKAGMMAVNGVEPSSGSNPRLIKSGIANTQTGMYVIAFEDLNESKV